MAQAVQLWNSMYLMLLNADKKFAIVYVTGLKLRRKIQNRIRM